MKKNYLFFIGILWMLFSSVIVQAQEYGTGPQSQSEAIQNDKLQMLQQLGISITHPNVTWMDNGADPNKPGCATTKAGSEGQWLESGIAYTIHRSLWGLWNSHGGDPYRSLPNCEEDKYGYLFRVNPGYSKLELSKLANGTSITTINQWNTKKNEMFAAVQDELYGRIPDKSLLPGVNWEITRSTGGADANAYIQYAILGTIDISSYPEIRNAPKIEATLRIPATVGKSMPIMIGFSNSHLKNAFANGWGTCAYKDNSLQPEGAANLTSYIVGLVNKGQWRKPNDWGELVAASWGVTKLIDLFEGKESKVIFLTNKADQETGNVPFIDTTDGFGFNPVDTKCIGTTGHSRWGKMALISMVYEPRVAISFPSCSGALGVNQSRRHWGQDLENIASSSSEYSWMSGNFFKWVGPLTEGGYLPRKVENLTVDGHSLLALCAPRPVFLNGGVETGDSWQDPYGAFLSAEDADFAYHIYGYQGVVMEDVNEAIDPATVNGNSNKIPVVNKAYIDGRIGYRAHSASEGGHAQTTGDIDAFWKFAEIHLTAASPFPPFPPVNVDRAMDSQQMMWQLGLSFTPPSKPLFYQEFLLPKLQSLGSDVTFKPKSETSPEGGWTWASGTSSLATDYTGNVTGERTGAGLWNNYIQSWEPGGGYFTGADFYKPLELHNLEGVTKANWSTRRQAIFDEVKKIWGAVPAEANELAIAWSTGVATEGSANDVEYKEYSVKGSIDCSGYPELKNAPQISAVLRLPKNTVGKAPVIICLASRIDASLWASVAPLGIGVCAYDYGKVQPDNGNGLTSYIVGLINKGNWRKPGDWGALVAWSWGASKLIDYFTTDSDVDETQVGITGHSRCGKATLVAMAYDERFAFSYPSSSGSLGAAQTRRHWGQDLGNSLWDQEYHWMAGNFMMYAGVDESSTDGYMPRKAMQMKVDAESLLALCAPRPVYIGCGELKGSGGDTWVDPYGQYLTCVAASPVYELLGKQGVKMDDVMDYKGKNIPFPLTNKAYIEGDIAYRRHDGGHVATPNYPDFALFIKKYLGNHSGVTNTKKDLNLTVYPNPATDRIYFSQKANYSITDISGKVIQKGNDATQASVDKLINGIYFITLSTQDDPQTVVSKLIKK